jgi:ATP adenylyltransferase|tara:strand:+ start:222 stop:710 length:489 start_codon:yes stop_codon:yes gene_type:complete
MEKLWTPWRLEYIKTPKTGSCIFCDLPESQSDRENHILYRGKYCFVIMNAFPYSNGHLMVIPYKHSGCVSAIDDNETEELWRLTKHCVSILRKTYSAQGFNIGLNLGKAGGAGYEEHLHNHIVPRWEGDTNFMPVLADVKALPEHLMAGYDKLLPQFKNITS